MNTPITRESLKDHFSYNWWKYLLVVVTAYFVFGPRPIGLLYTVTTHTPPEKEVSFYVYGQINEKARTIIWKTSGYPRCRTWNPCSPPC